MLSVSRLVNVQVNLSPLGAQTRNFGVLNIAGDSNVINGLERSRNYTSMTGVALDFGTTAPEYLAAQLYFAQSPQPINLTISRWLRTASSGMLIGAILNNTQQALSNFTAITAGTLSVTVDGSVESLTGLNFSGAANLNAVAAIVQTALSGPSFVWTGSQFKLTSNTTGTSSSVTVATGTTAALFGMSSAATPTVVPGYAAETALQCATALDAFSPNWYGLMFASSVMPSTSDNLAVSSFIEATSVSRMFGVTTQDTGCLTLTDTTDVASELMALNPDQTCVQYSSSSPYAIASLFGRAFSVDFTGNNTTIALMYKQEPLVVAENLTESQAEALEAKRCNVFVSYNNDTAILEDGVMSGPAFFDEIHGLDYAQNAIQTACYNLLYTNQTKIPQTDAGVGLIMNTIAGVCDQLVSDGLVAPGQWNAAGFGSLQQGQQLKTGYYIYAQPVALQSESDRAARKSPPIQVALKLAGAIGTMNAIVNVNR